MKLFRYIYSTDAFFKTYQKLLCIRVLSDNLKNRDMEIDLISELRYSHIHAGGGRGGGIEQDHNHGQRYHQQ